MRYIVVNGSMSGHCCFEYSIVDVSKGKYDTGSWIKTMCECFDKVDAIAICYLLNEDNTR